MAVWNTRQYSGCPHPQIVAQHQSKCSQYAVGLGHNITIFHGCKPRKSVYIYSLHDNRRTMNWINARYIACRRRAHNQCTCKWELGVWPILTLWHYLTIHLQLIRSDRYVIEHIHKAHNKPNITMADSRTITHSNSKARLFHWDQNQPQLTLQ